MPSLSREGTSFVLDHEGCPLKAYRCPAGVITIGPGFTMRSKVFAAWWRAKYGRGLRLGDTISRTDVDVLLPKVFNDEYGAAVNAKIGTTVQHEYDGSGSMAYNCGTGALNWTWAKLLKARDVPGAAKRLRTTAVTANGRRLAGLVRRRREEAELIEHGNYGQIRSVPSSVSSRTDEVMQYQKQLSALGYELVVDGVAGKNTIKAVKSFQRNNDLTVDGIVGPATRAALIRALDTKRGKQAAAAAPTAAGGMGAGSTDAAVQSGDFLLSVALWGGGALLAVGIIFLILRYRGVITGKRVPT